MQDISLKKSLFYFSILLFVLELIVYKDFIFGDYCFLYKDLGDDGYTLAFPELYAKIESLKLGQIPQWNFNTALGENKYPDWLEPITMSIVLLFFKNDIPSALIWVHLVYTFLSGIVLFSFFRNSKFHYVPSAIGAILFVFSGYVLGCSTWFFEYAQEALLLSFLLFSAQLFIQRKSFFLLPISVALIGICANATLFYFSFFVLLVYLILNAETLLEKKQIIPNVARLLLAGVLSFGLSSFIIWSNLYLINHSARGAGMYPLQDTFNKMPIQWIDKTELSTSILRLFSNNLQGVADNFKGWYNYFEAPFWYCGLITLLLIPQLFHFLNRKNKIIYGSIIVCFILIALVPYFRIALWVFSGNYYRTIGIMITLFLLLFATQALHYMLVNKKVYTKTLLITSSSLLLLLFSQKNAILDDASPNITFICILLIIYTSLLYFFNKQDSKNYITYALFGIICLEVISFSNATLAERRIITQQDFKKGYNDITKNIISNLKKADTTFYRIEKDYFSSISNVQSYNDAQVQGFYGSAGYCAFHNANYIQFLKSIDALYIDGEVGSRFVQGIREIPEAMQICGVKYFISNQDSITKNKNQFDLIKEMNGYRVYQLKNNLPLGFTYSQYITENNFDKLNVSEKRNLLNKAIVVGSDFEKRLNKLKTYNSTEIQHNLFKISSFQNNEIKGNINLSQPEILFFSIPFDEGWAINVNGKVVEKQKVFHGLTGIYLDKGNYKIELSYEAPYRKMGTIISIITLLVMILLAFVNKRKSFL